MPWRRIGRSTSTTPWSKSISITRSATMHSRPIETCWKAEIVHSWPITGLDPISTSPSWARGLWAGETRELARGISPVEDDDPEGWALVREVYPRTGSAAVVGFTGPPGAGKSTLIGALVAHRRREDREVAVLSIDPSSPFR